MAERNEKVIVIRFAEDPRGVLTQMGCSKEVTMEDMAAAFLTMAGEIRSRVEPDTALGQSVAAVLKVYGNQVAKAEDVVGELC